MQIHELNTLGSIPGNTDFLAIDTGFDTAKISADKLLEPKLNRPIDEHNQYDDGADGQLLRSKGDGSTEWSDVGQPTDAQTAQAVSDWLDAHPEATTTVADGSLTETKFSAALQLQTIKDYVTPEMFGAVGDGVADDSAAVQAAFDSGKSVLCQNAYLVSDLTITNPLILRGGEFINGGSTNYVISVSADNVYIENIVLDAKELSNGISFSYCNNGAVRNCEIKNAKATDDTYALYINRSNDITIDGCLIHDIANSNSKPTRGILANRSFRTIIQNTIVHDISSGNDGDGIQIIFDGSSDETDEGSTIRNCRIYNCTKRYIKIQQRNCTIENCILLEDDSTFAASDASIALYDCNCTIRDSFINGNCVIQITLGGSELEEAVFENTLIVNNIIKSISTDSSFTLIGNPTSPASPFRNLSIIGNHFIGLTKFTGITFRNLSGDNLNISNNCFYNLNTGVYWRWDTGKPNPVINNVVISNNCFKDIKTTPLYCQYTQYHLNYLAIIGNVYNVTTGLGGRLNIIVIDPASYDTDKITIENNIGNGYDGWARVGSWSTVPTGVPDGFVYFCRDILMPVTYFNGNWYKPDGTIYNG